MVNNLLSGSTAIMVGIITGSAAIIATILTQLITAFNSRKSDERKEKAEIKRMSLKKRIDVAENFYHMFKESLLNLHRLNAVYENERKVQTEEGRIYLRTLKDDIGAKAVKLVEDTRLWNLTDIYFNIESTEEITARDVKSMIDLNGQKVDLESLYENTDDADEREIILIKYHNTTANILELVSNNIARVKRDLLVIKTELLCLSTRMEN